VAPPATDEGWAGSARGGSVRRKGGLQTAARGRGHGSGVSGNQESTLLCQAAGTAKYRQDEAGVRGRYLDWVHARSAQEEELIRLPWRGQCGRAAAGCARTAAALRC
jgi:hypothetical protein